MTQPGQLELPLGDTPVHRDSAPVSDAVAPLMDTLDDGVEPGGEGGGDAQEMQRAANALLATLRQKTGLRLNLTVTDNSTRVLSLRPSKQSDLLSVRVHHMFLNAEPEVVTALAAWIKKPRSGKSGDILNAFIRDNRGSIRALRSQRILMCTRGTHFDLAELYGEVNDEQFAGSVNVPITWGRLPAPGRRRSIRFGSYSEKDKLIRIHPLLDQGFVPRFFVRYIVYHEMLHAFVGIGRSPSGRRRIHAKDFKCQEEAYPDFARAVEWQKNPDHLRRLLKGTKGYLDRL